MKNDKKYILSFIYLVFSYTFFFLSIHFLPFLHFSYDLLLIFSLIDIFIFLHIILDIKKMYNFIYKKRYFIGVLIFAFLVAFKYNGSSIEIWNGAIQPEYQLKSSVVLGKLRSIRSDEWLVVTPISLTQATETVNFSKINTILGATSNLVTLNPKLPSKNILSLITNPNNIGYLFLDTERAFSFSWYFGYFVLFFATFEMLMILTKKNKLFSFLGSTMITFSPVIQWWQSPSIIAYGALAIIFFYNFIINSCWKKKLLYSILVGYAGLLYIMCLYPAWQVPYGYCYLVIVIYLTFKYKDKLKWKDLLYLIPTVSVILSMMLPILISNKEVFEITSNTVYPGSRLSTGGGNWEILFTYINSIYYPFKDFGNPCEFSQYFSIFPIPLIYGIYLMIKNKKVDLFIILSSIILSLLSLWVILPMGEIFSKITLLYMSTEVRVQVAIGYLSVILLIYLLSKYEKEGKIFNYKNLIVFIISLISAIITVKISNTITNKIFPGYLNINMTILSVFILTIIITLILINNKKTNYLLSIILILISIISGAIVSPINKGLDVFYEKPLAKQIQKMVKEDPGAIYIGVDSGIVLSNYLAVNGAKTINTTNFIPNLKLYNKLDPEKKYNDVYNRYEHVAINIVDNKTKFILNQADFITIELNIQNICKTNAKYIVTTNLDRKYKEFKQIYEEYGVRIFETGCEG